jgi:hypothetical protein
LTDEMIKYTKADMHPPPQYTNGKNFLYKEQRKITLTHIWTKFKVAFNKEQNGVV